MFLLVLSLSKEECWKKQVDYINVTALDNPCNRPRVSKTFIVRALRQAQGKLRRELLDSQAKPDHSKNKLIILCQIVDGYHWSSYVLYDMLCLCQTL